MSPVQFRLRSQPKKGVVHPFGMNWWSWAPETDVMAMKPMASEAVVRTINWSTSVMTTLNIPPLTAYTAVNDIRMTAYMSGDTCQGKKIAANFPMPLNA